MNIMYENEIKEWLQERDEAVSSLNLEKFKTFYNKWRDKGIYKLSLPSDDVTEIALHTIALEIPSISEEVKEKAYKWLMENDAKK